MNILYLQQEVFEARFSKLPQQPKGCVLPLLQVEKQKPVMRLSTSASSDSESSSTSESPSEGVAMQLASILERVGIGHGSNAECDALSINSLKCNLFNRVYS